MERQLRPSVMVATPPQVLSTADSPFQSNQDTGNGSLDLGSILSVLKRRRVSFLVTLALITAGVGAHTIYQRIVNPVYQGSFRLLIRDPLRESTEGEGGSLESVARNIPTIDTAALLQVLQSPAVLSPVLSSLQQDGVEPGDLPKIQVTEGGAEGGRRRSGSTGVLEVKATGSDPDVLRKALQLTEQTYLGWATQQRQQRTTVGLQFLESQEPRLRSANEQLQAELKRFRETNTVIQPTEEAAALRSRLEQLQAQLQNQQGEQRQLREMRAEVASGRLSARNFAVSGSSGQSAGGGGSLSANLPSQSQLDELQRLEQEIAVAEANFQPGSPLLSSLQATRNSLLPQIQAKQLAAVDAARRQNDNAIATTQAQIARLETQFRDQPELLRQYGAIEQRLQIADSNLQSFLQTKDQFQLEQAQEQSPWSVISAPNVSGTPVEPSVSRGLLNGLLFGVVGGAAVAFLRERMEPVYHTSKEAREQLKLPLLGHIPYTAEFDGVHNGEAFPIADVQKGELGEIMRNLCTNLRFLHTPNPLHSLMITSSASGEGKSLASVLLAQTLSELGQRVLLVDADLRQPKIHQRLNLDNERGLSTLISENNLNWRDVIQEIPAFPGLHVLPAGPENPDPARLLGSETMSRLIRDIADENTFDLVLYDAPPVLYFSDTALVAQHMHGVVLLVGLNQTNRDLATQSVERIQEIGTPLLGLVTNSRIQNLDETISFRSWTRGYPALS